VNFSLALFLAKYEQFVVRFFRHGMVSEKFLLPGRSGAAIRQGAHFHDFVDGENDVQLYGLEYVLIAGLHCIAPDEGGGVLGHKDRVASIQRHGSLRIARVECPFVRLE
jgi:hypothetical protein